MSGAAVRAVAPAAGSLFRLILNFLAHFFDVLAGPVGGVFAPGGGDDEHGGGEGGKEETLEVFHMGCFELSLVLDLRIPN